MKPVLSIIIVNFNTKDLLKKCLESIKLSFDYEIIVVDNASNDDSLQSINSLELKNLKIINNKTNLGFAKAVNQGIRQSQGEFILLLNSDIVVKPKAIEKMIDFAKNNLSAGVVGGRLLNPDGSIQGSCFYLPTLGRAAQEFWLGKNEKSIVRKYAPVGNKLSEVEAVVGAVFLIPRKILQKVGFFDERYFIYFEDLDYCRRVRRNGFKVYYLPTTEFIHAHGASGKSISEKTQKWLVESSQIYHGKFKYFLISFFIKTGQKCRKILGNSSSLV